MEEDNLSEDQKNEIMGILEKYGNPRLAIPSLPLLEELTNGLLMDAIDNQRMLIISAIDEWTSSSSNLSIQSEIIGFNGIMLDISLNRKICFQRNSENSFK